MYAKELWIVVVDGGPGSTEITAKSAQGLFEKYATESRVGTQRVVWKKISAGGDVTEVNRWEKLEATPSNAQTTATGALIEIGLYVVAHGQEESGQIAGGGPYSLITKLTAASVPRAQKVSFVACYSGRHDKEAAFDDRLRDYDPTIHGLPVEELSFISMFAVGYQDAYSSKGPLHVAGWESFVSVYHPDKTEDVPHNAKARDVGRKYVAAAGSNPYTFMKPGSSSRKTKKRMFRWAFVEGQARVEKIGLPEWKNST